MFDLNGKVAFITGVARGQGRCHAVTLAERGADIIGVDLCDQVSTVPYAMATPEDMAETVRQVEALDRRIVCVKADTRDVAALQSAVTEGVRQFGSLDIVVANAGIASHGSDGEDIETFRDLIDINLTGVWNTMRVAAPLMIEQGTGGAIVLTSSTQGLSGRGGDGTAATTGYSASKHGVVGLMRSYANWLAPHGIRVTSVHPTAVNTPLAINDAMAKWAAGRATSSESVGKNLLPVRYVEPIDVSAAVLYLVSDEARYVTGVALPVDAGFTAK